MLGHPTRFEDLCTLFDRAEFLLQCDGRFPSKQPDLTSPFTSRDAMTCALWLRFALSDSNLIAWYLIGFEHLVNTNSLSVRPKGCR
ncbi:hypothetical protein PGTUg99_023633 [Puccinia graminis f. sp. tritici]|uniref:Uncharacterized protein n=1 Tax=Puccinia graminis f. sp. tritici TaxID=56615 RepID=A0A5B0QU61_PUCGR|nr:hypothetical protein PGTUg99_023633 [Puccinia graminis f. sp. tritici]